MQWVNFFHIYQPPAWDEAIVRRVAAESYLPLINILKQHPQIKITLNITGALIEQLVELGLNDVLTGIRQLAEAGQVELVGSAMYHPILPLLPFPEVERQIELQEQLLKKIFGEVFKPQGFFPPEMAFSPSLEKILLDRGYKWVILDELAARQTLGEISFEHRYQTAGGLSVIFRNRSVSDFLSFSASITQPDQAVASIQKDGRSKKFLITAMDGENLGHHRPGVDRLWEFLIDWPDFTTITASQYLLLLNDHDTISLHDCSWSSQKDEVVANIPFSLWNHPNNPIHKLQWQLTYLVIDAINHASNDPAHDAARRLLDRALTSDKYWWASASPWWDMTIVIRETQRLVDVIAPLEHIPTKIKNQAGKLMQQLATTVELWEKTGLSKRRQATYLQTTGDVRYMGGRRLI